MYVRNSKQTSKYNIEITYNLILSASLMIQPLLPDRIVIHRSYFAAAALDRVGTEQAF